VVLDEDRQSNPKKWIMSKKITKIQYALMMVSGCFWHWLLTKARCLGSQNAEVLATDITEQKKF
jgi:hypothetical protein